jgi:hypothetical protein
MNEETRTQETLRDEDIISVIGGGTVTVDDPLPKDTDGTDGDTSDGVDGDGTDGTDGDAGDGDGTDGQDADGTDEDVADADGTDQ